MSEQGEAFFRGIVEAAGQGVWTIDGAFKTTYVNPRMGEMLGYAREEMLGAPLGQFLDAADSAGSSDRFARLFAGERVVHEAVFRHKAGHRVHAQVACTPLVGGSGRFEGAIALCDDIGERRKAEAERARTLQELAIIAETVDRAPVAIQVFDERGFTYRTNEAMRRFLGLPDKDYGVGTWNCLTEAECVRSGLADVFRRAYAGETVSQDLTMNLGNFNPRWEVEGRTVHFEQLVFPVHRDGRVVAVVSMVRDVTERKEMERSLREAQRLESLGLLAGGIAHDFNNFLAAILGNADLSLSHLDDAHPARTFIEPVLAAARRAADLTHQLLAYAGRRPAGAFATALDGVVQETTELLRLSVPRNVVLDVTLRAADVVVAVEPAPLRQIVMNLVINAAQAIGSGEGRVHVRTGILDATSAARLRLRDPSALQHESYGLLEVEDTGCGMDAATRERIFDPFFTTKSTGRGLGLSVVHGVVRNLDGLITVESEPGRGTTFRVLLPVRRGAAPRALRARHRALEGEQGALVLVADDDDIVRQVTLAMLERLGLRVASAADGNAALRLYEARGHEARAIILDITMPGQSGVHVYRTIRGRDARIPILLMSGHTTDGDLPRLEEDVHAAFLAKPFNLRGLEAKLVDLLSPSARVDDLHVAGP